MASRDAEEEGGIQVFLRIRPSDDAATRFQRDEIDLNQILVKIPKKADDETVNNSRTGYNFSFSGILDEAASQRDVFRTVGIPALKNALAGFNSTIFAYGQTGSGKTFTITGGPEKYEHRGIIPRALAHLFKAMKGEEEQGTTFTCYVSYLEIYNQTGYDLLHTPSTAGDDIPKVTMLEDEYGNFHFKNLSMHAVSSEEDALNLLFLGDTNRAIAATEMNENSTRSHCIFTVVLEKRSAGADTVTRSKLNIVDLAGSERVSRSNSAGQTLTEAKYINSSLFFLEMVIVALHDKEKKRKEHVHVPYRNSMMTSVLRDSLGGNCKTIMIATISPEAQHTDESISTCHFAQRVALVKNSASVNEEVEPEQVILRLKAEVRRLREEVEFLSGKNDDDSSGDEGENESGNQLPQHKRNELAESIQQYVNDRDESSSLDFCGGITLPKLRAVCSIFKEMLRRKPEGTRTIDDDRGSSDEESSDEGSVAQRAKSRDSRQSGRPANVVGGTARQSNESSTANLVCGVPTCTDKQVLDEPNVAFAWFKDQYPGLAAMEKTKISLKTKYSEAKSAGRTIEEIRSRINHHKESIERLRRNHAISMVSGHEEKASEEAMAEEKRHCDAIDREKAAYKETLDRLRGLKGTIETQKEVVEKARLKLQSDFDEWYQRCESRRESLRAQSNTAAKTRTGSVSQSTTAISSSGGDGSASAAKDIEPPAGEASDDFQLPPGVQLTGNAEADADIIAFFRAKELLLSRKG
ncbi:hypothetical protein ACHAXT_012255 [Thalassiosira profunda]